MLIPLETNFHFPVFLCQSFKGSSLYRINSNNSLKLANWTRTPTKNQQNEQSNWESCRNLSEYGKSLCLLLKLDRGMKKQSLFISGNHYKLLYPEMGNVGELFIFQLKFYLQDIKNVMQVTLKSTLKIQQAHLKHSHFKIPPL